MSSASFTLFCYVMQVLTAWQIPYMSVTKAGATAEEMTAARDAMEESPKVLVVSITVVAREETKRFLRRQKILVISVDEAQACSIANAMTYGKLHFTSLYFTTLIYIDYNLLS